MRVEETITYKEYEAWDKKNFNFNKQYGFITVTQVKNSLADVPKIIKTLRRYFNGKTKDHRNPNWSFSLGITVDEEFAGRYCLEFKKHSRYYLYYQAPVYKHFSCNGEWIIRNNEVITTAHPIGEPIGSDFFIPLFTTGGGIYEGT